MQCNYNPNIPSDLQYCINHFAQNSLPRSSAYFNCKCRYVVRSTYYFYIVVLAKTSGALRWSENISTKNHPNIGTVAPCLEFLLSTLCHFPHFPTFKKMPLHDDPKPDFFHLVIVTEPAHVLLMSCVWNTQGTMKTILKPNMAL